MRSWVIGRSSECDVVVDAPSASDRHARLTHGPDGLILEDLRSTSGTYVDSKRINGQTRVTPGQEITIGQTTPMPWPPDLVKFARIGRIEGNDIVLNDLRVSSRHARLMVVAGSEALIEDLGSSNGTFLNSVECRVTRLTPLSKNDTVYFGSMSVPAATLLAGLLVPPAEPPPKRPPPIPAPEPPRHAAPQPPRQEWAPAPALLPRSGNLIGQNRWLLVALCQAPVLALLILLTSGRQAAAAVTEANGSAVAGAITATTFALAFAALWLGCSFAVADAAAGFWPKQRSHLDPNAFFADLGSRLGILFAACALGCAALLAVVYWGSGLKGSWFLMWCVMVMASTVGLLLGLLISTLVSNWQIAAPAVLVCLVLMFALGGWLWPLGGKSLPVHLAAGLMPSRWAFENVLLLEAPQHAGPVSPGEKTSALERDLAEDYFPAESDRMGAMADTTALALMLLGMAVALVLASSRST